MSTIKLIRVISCSSEDSVGFVVFNSEILYNLKLIEISSKQSY